MEWQGNNEDALCRKGQKDVKSRKNLTRLKTFAAR